jgi:hypothetical protein
MSRAQKTPLSRSLSTFAQKKALDEIAKRGMALPGHVVVVSGQIVTVNFDVDGVTLPQVTMPVQGSKYIRLPIQKDDLGYALPGDVYMGGVSGLGGGTADLTPRGNLATLVWFPVGNKDWTVVPAGVVLDTPAVTATGNLSVANGASGVFTTMTGDTVTVQNGIIVNIA